MNKYIDKYLKYKNKYLYAGENNKKLKKITPQSLYKLYNTNKKIAIFNTLDNKNHFLVPLPFDNKNKKKYLDLYPTKESELINNNFDLIVFYCANYTCPRSHTFATKFLKNNPDYKNKVILYEGGLFEWSLLSLLYNEFGIYNVDKDKLLTQNELLILNKNNKHWDENKKDPKNKSYPDVVYETSKLNPNWFDNLKLKNLTMNKISVKLLENKNCVVTGATSGLGLQTLKTMLDFGAQHVTGTYFNDEKRANNVIKELNKIYDKKRFKIIKADARTEEGNKLTFNKNKRKHKLKLEDKYLPVHCVDINAGIFGPASMNTKHVFNIHDKDYDAVMNINLRGYYLGVKHFSKQAIKNNIENASIVCIKSIYGSTGSLFSNIAYQMSKHGVMGLVRQSAIELARPNELLKLKHPIRVNAVSPTFTDTALTRPMLNNEKIFDVISDSNTNGKLAKKEDIANAVVFLCSELSGSITGIDLPVDCGVLSESVPTYREVKDLNDDGIELLSCCGNTTE